MFMNTLREPRSMDVFPVMASITGGLECALMFVS